MRSKNTVIYVLHPLKDVTGLGTNSRFVMTWGAKELVLHCPDLSHMTYGAMLKPAPEVWEAEQGERPNGVALRVTEGNQGEHGYRGGTHCSASAQEVGACSWDTLRSQQRRPHPCKNCDLNTVEGQSHSTPSHH